MKSITFYRISSYFLIIIAAILSFIALVAFVVALSNPLLLLSVFVIVSVVIYSFTSFTFLIKGMDGQQYLTPKLKDWIKVNAYVAIVFVFMNIFQSVTVISNPSVINDALKQVTALQKNASPLPVEMMVNVMKGVIWFLLFYAVVLGIHISSTFRLLKQYQYLFGKEPEADNF